MRWPEAAIDNYAAALDVAHRPDRSRVGVRWRWRIIPRPVLQSTHCLLCELDWPCPAAAWAQWRLSSYARQTLSDAV
ncbi:hypothetical protein [Actinopolymorpha alba]|uniref:hypothetical protein n=1 Tax=Actinopolymorpha alba TaxID=533267 RepID=UPI00036954E3|nr:hypothetical protein [Actinopolymorpha alba]